MQSILIDSENTETDNTEIIYAYDRIRQILKDGILVYDYSYEFIDGQEIVVIKDVENKEERRFSEERLLEVFGLSTGFRTSYTYDDSGKVTQAVTERAGRIFATYNYTYEGSDTIITDEDGTLRRYGEEGVLKRLEKSTGEVYVYSSFSDALGEDLMLQELKQITNTTLGTAEYIEEKPVRVMTPEGIEITGIVLDEERNILQAQIRYPEPDSKIVIIENRMVIYISSAGGEFQDFEGGFLERWVDGQGNLTTLTYTKDDAGQILSITVEDNDGTRTYTTTGALTQAVLPDTTQIDYSPDGNIAQIFAPSGDHFSYVNGLLNSIEFASGLGSLDEIVLYGDGTLKSGVYSSNGTILTFENGIILRKEEPDGTIYIYHSNGIVSEIHEPVGGAFNEFYYDVNGGLTRVERWNGDEANTIATDAQDRLEDADLYLNDGFTGRILTTGINPLNSRPLVNGVLMNPGAVDLTCPWASPIHSYLLAESYSGGFLRYDPAPPGKFGGIEDWLPQDISNLGYIKVAIRQGNWNESPSVVRFQLRHGLEVVYSRDYPSPASSYAQDVYFEIPEGIGPVDSFQILFDLDSRNTSNRFIGIEPARKF